MGDNKENQVEQNQIIISHNDPQSPYFLSNADHPGYIISLVILNGDNYEN